MIQPLFHRLSLSSLAHSHARFLFPLFPSTGLQTVDLLHTIIMKRYKYRLYCYFAPNTIPWKTLQVMERVYRLSRAAHETQTH